MATLITAVLTGAIAPLRGSPQSSAIGKRAASGPVAVETLGLVGDHQADLRVHGGPEKAIHHYPFDHYAAWLAELGPHPLLAAPGGFGENISTTGLTEAHVHLGDRFRLGTALVEVCQGRQPCWKQRAHLGVATIVAQMVKTRRCGWYYRVLEPGKVAAGDELELVEPGLADWPIERLFTVLIAGGHKAQPDTLAELAALLVLAAGWRRRAAELLG